MLLWAVVVVDIVPAVSAFIGQFLDWSIHFLIRLLLNDTVVDFDRLAVASADNYGFLEVFWIYLDHVLVTTRRVLAWQVDHSL